VEAKGALYRLADSETLEPHLLVTGDLHLVCMAGVSNAWALMSRGKEVRLVSVATDTPAVAAVEPGALVARALLDEPALPKDVSDVIVESLAEARASGRPEATRLALAMAQDARPQLRRAAAPALIDRAGASTVAALWLLAHDQAVEVRWAALDAAEGRCATASNAICRGLLTIFFDDAEPDIAWEARDVLLYREPATALFDAPRDYKLDVLSRLTIAVEAAHAPEAQRALDLLQDDPDSEVRELAVTISSRTVH
jgi:hypothetical protein